jgi:hypothetical protein
VWSMGLLLWWEYPRVGSIFLKIELIFVLK